MAKDSDLGLSPDDIAHQKVMRSIAEKMADTPYVLKGGTALLLTRGLDRHSVDLDFDATKGVKMEGRINASFKESGLDIDTINVKKDTASKQRYMVHYANPDTGNANTLKIETGLGLDIDPAKVEMVDGIKTYTVPTLYGQKLDAMQGEKPRNAVRDLYDIGFLLKNHGKKLTQSQLDTTDKLHTDLDGLADRYKASHDVDPLLTHVSLDDLILENREAVDGLIKARQPQTAQERIAATAAAIKNPERREAAMQKVANMQALTAKATPAPPAQGPKSKARDFGPED